MHCFIGCKAFIALSNVFLKNSYNLDKNIFFDTTINKGGQAYYWNNEN
jgi:hypothetical protein